MVSRIIQVKLLKIKRAKRSLPRYLSAEAVTTTKYDANHPLAIGKRKFRAPDKLPGQGDIYISDKNLRRYAREAGMPFEQAVKVIEEINQEREEQLGLEPEGQDTAPRQFNSIAQAKAALKAKPTARKPNMDASKGSVRTYLNEPMKRGEKAKPDKTFARPEFYEPQEQVSPIEVGEGISVVNGQPTEETLMLSSWSNWKRQGNTLFIRMNCVERTNYSLDLWFYQDKVYYFELDYEKKLGRRSRNYFSVNRALKEMDYIRWVEEIPI